jgi:hypothetical protein
MAFLLAGKPSGRTTLTVIDRILHTRLPKTHTAPPGILADDTQQIHWIAAESLDAALRYMRLRHDDFIIREARFVSLIPRTRFVDMVPLLSAFHNNA